MEEKKLKIYSKKRRRRERIEMNRRKAKYN